MSREPKPYSSITILFAELSELTTLKNTEALDLETAFVVHEEPRCSLKAPKMFVAAGGLEDEGTIASQTIFLIQLQNCRNWCVRKKLNTGRLKD
jgi:hypothetical protein